MTAQFAEHDVRPLSIDLIIGGRAHRESSTRMTPVHDPAIADRVVGLVVDGTKDDTRAAIDAADQAFAGWAALSFQERAAYLQTAADRIEQDADERINLLVQENGKIRREAMMDLARLVRRIRGTAEYAEELAEEINFAAPPRSTKVVYQPLGVAGLIVPWNWPLSILGAKLPQALLAGNTVVVKPSPLAPIAAMMTLRLMADILPPGVINAVTGSAEEVGGALLADPRVRKIDFTGGVQSGRAVMAAAAPTLKRLTLELGGNDAAIVLSDAEINNKTLATIASAAFMTTGQTCMAIKRLYVHHSRYAEVRDGLSYILSRTVVGNGLNPHVTMGPVISDERKNAVRGLVDAAAVQGAEVRHFGTALDRKSFDQGHFLLPSLIFGADHSFRVVNEEQFGPTLPVMTFRDEQEAVALANDSDYGLCSSVWTTDIDHGIDIARKLQAGSTHINHHGPAVQDDRAPFGGIKDSGVGHELGIHGVREFLHAHTITVA